MTWVLWGLFALIVAVNRFDDPPTPLNVFFVYYEAASRWLEGQPLYSGSLGAFMYLPQAAILFTPFTWLPFDWSGASWRLLNIGVFAYGVWRLARLANRGSRPHWFFLVSVPTILMSWSAARHGEMTLAMGGMMMLAVVDLADQRWWRATLWLTLGCALKPLILVLTLLAAALYPRTSWRLALALVPLVALPFLTQSQVYVLEQYRQIVPALGNAAEVGVDMEFAHLFGMLKAAGIDIPGYVQTVLRLAAAALTLAICWLAKKRCPPAEAAVLLYAMAVCYLMLFNPRTENNTYCLLAPALGVFTAEAAMARSRLRTGLGLGLVLLFLASHPIGKMFREHTVWIKPLLCAVFLGLLLRQLQHRLAEPMGAAAA
jgi:alpha-1,2-mannosyltransferase